MRKRLRDPPSNRLEWIRELVCTVSGSYWIDVTKDEWRSNSGSSLIFFGSLENPIKQRHWWQFPTLKNVIGGFSVQKRKQPAQMYILMMHENGLVPAAAPFVDSPRPEVQIFLQKIRDKGPQDQAIHCQLRHGGQVVAFDYRPDFLPREASNLQGFCLVPSWDYFEQRLVLDLPCDLRNYYEIVRPNVPVVFFFDFDGELSEYPVLQDKSAESIVNMLLECVRQVWETTAMSLPCLLTRKTIRFFESHNPGVKLSIHGVGIHDIVYWHNVAALRSFVSLVREKFVHALFDGTRSASDFKRHELLDLTVYDTNHKFRMWKSTKMNRQRAKVFSATLNEAPPPQRLTETLVCRYTAVLPSSILVLNALAQTTMPTNASLMHYPLLSQWLAPYATSSPGNYRWWAGSGAVQYFNLPPAVVEKLSRVLAAEQQRPFLLHEAPSAAFWKGHRVKLVLDFDKVPDNLNPLDLCTQLCRLISKHLLLLSSQLKLVLITSPPRKETPHYLQFHVAFQVQTASYRDYKRCVNLLQRETQWTWLDAPSCMRTLGSDKFSNNATDGRANVYGGTFVFHNNDAKGLERVPDPQDEERRFELCSMFAGMEDLPQWVLVGEGKEAQDSYDNHAEEEIQRSSPTWQWVERQWLAACCTDEQRHRFRLTRVIRKGPGHLQSRTNLKWCIFDQVHHGSQTQKGDHFRTHWRRSCWSSGSCSGQGKEYAYLELPPPPEGAFPSCVEEPAAVIDPWIALALSCYPQDSALWTEANYRHWFKGAYFGPSGATKVHYQWRGPTSLTRRCKETDSVQIVRLPAVSGHLWGHALFPGIACDNGEAASALLADLDAWVAESSSLVVPVGVFAAGPGVCYYGALGICATPLLTISLWQGKCKPSPPLLLAFPATLSAACVSFTARHLSLPPPPAPDPAKTIQDWLSLGIAAKHVFHLTDPPEMDMRLPEDFPALRPGMVVLLVAPMGAGKTELVRRLRADCKRFLYVCPLRSLARGAAAKFGIAHHLELNEQGEERVRQDLAQLKSVCVVMNSLRHLRGQLYDLVFWDEFRQDLLALLSEPVMANGAAAAAVSIFETMAALFKSSAVQVVADAHLESSFEGQFLQDILGPERMASDVYVIIKDTERNPWTDMRDCYQLLGDEASAWQSAITLIEECRRRGERTFFPVNEELAVHVAEKLLNGQGDFLCGSAEKTPRYRRLTQSTKAWAQTEVLCATGVISSGLSCTERLFSQCINWVGNRSDNSWDNAQKWIRQRPKYDQFLFYFRDRGCSEPPPLEEADLEQLSSWTRERLELYLPGPVLSESASRLGPVLSKVFTQFAVRAAHLQRRDRFQLRQNVIKLLHARNATIRFMEPVSPPLSEERRKEIQTIITSQSRVERMIGIVLQARLLTDSEFRHLDEQKGSLSEANRLALKRARLARRYHVRQNDEMAMRQCLVEHYKDKLPAKMECLQSTVLAEPANLAHNDNQGLAQPLLLQRHLVLEAEMTQRIMNDIFSLRCEWFRQLEHAPVVQQLEHYVWTKPANVDYELGRLSALLSTDCYRLLHLKDPRAFPVLSKATKDSWTKLYGFFKAFLQKARGIPLVRRESRITQEKKRVKISRYCLRYAELVARVHGYHDPPDSLETVDVHSLERTEQGTLLINGHEIEVPVCSDQQQQQFILTHELPSPLYNFYEPRWAWFLRGRVAVVKLRPGYDGGMLRLRQLLLREGYGLLDGPVTFQTCRQPRLQIDWIRLSVTDVSEYTEEVEEVPLGPPGLVYFPECKKPWREERGAAIADP